MLGQLGDLDGQTLVVALKCFTRLQLPLQLLFAEFEFLQFISLPPQQLIKPVVLLGEHDKLVLVLIHSLLDAPDFLLPEVKAVELVLQSVYFGHTPVVFLPRLPEFCDHGLQFVLVLDGEFLDLTVDVALPLGLELHPHFLEFLGLRLLQTGEPVSPLIEFPLQLLAPGLLETVFLLESGIDLAVFEFVLLELAVQLLAEDLHALSFLVHALLLHLEHVASFGQLTDLHLVTLKVVPLALPVLGTHPEDLDLLGQSFDFNALEDHHEVEFGGEVFLAIAREVGDAGAE